MYGVSYDSQEDLAKFSDRHGISYPLLADVGSKVIERFGILNTLIDPDEPSGRRIYGVPFPGTYVVDRNGVVTEKFFNRHYATRTSAGTLLDTAAGKVLIHAGAPSAEAMDAEVRITAFLADEDLKLERSSLLYTRIEVPQGFHVYGAPLPEGYFATTAHVQEVKGIRVGESSYPETHPREFEALGVTLNVYEGTVEVATPVTATADLLNWGVERDTMTVDVPIVVRYQAGSEEVCYLPRTVELSLELPLAELTLPTR